MCLRNAFPGGQEWGVEVGVRRLTAETLITSLLGHCPCVPGPGFREYYFRQLDIRVTLAIARRTTGVNGAARLPAPYPVAGVPTVNNLSTRRCARVLHLALIAEGSQIQARMKKSLEKVYGEKNGK